MWTRRLTSLKKTTKRKIDKTTSSMQLLPTMHIATNTHLHQVEDPIPPPTTPKFFLNVDTTPHLPHQLTHTI